MMQVCGDKAALLMQGQEHRLCLLLCGTLMLVAIVTMAMVAMVMVAAMQVVALLMQGDVSVNVNV